MTHSNSPDMMGLCMVLNGADSPHLAVTLYVLTTDHFSSGFVESKIYTWRIYLLCDKLQTILDFKQNIGDKMPKEFADEYQPLLIKETKDKKRPKVCWLSENKSFKLSSVDTQWCSFLSMIIYVNTCFVSLFIAVSEQITSAGCVCCVYRGNLSVWI